MSDVVFIVIPVIKTDKDPASQTRLNWQLMLSVLAPATIHGVVDGLQIRNSLFLLIYNHDRNLH